MCKRPPIIPGREGKIKGEVAAEGKPTCTHPSSELRRVLCNRRGRGGWGEGGEGGGCWFVGCVFNVPANMLVCPRDGSEQVVVRAATLK